jgi:hypothetical protein
MTGKRRRQRRRQPGTSAGGDSGGDVRRPRDEVAAYSARAARRGGPRLSQTVRARGYEPMPPVRVSTAMRGSPLRTVPSRRRLPRPACHALNRYRGQIRGRSRPQQKYAPAVVIRFQKVGEGRRLNRYPERSVVTPAPSTCTRQDSGGKRVRLLRLRGPHRRARARPAAAWHR